MHRIAVKAATRTCAGPPPSIARMRAHAHNAGSVGGCLPCWESRRGELQCSRNGYQWSISKRHQLAWSRWKKRNFVGRETKEDAATTCGKCAALHFLPLLDAVAALSAAGGRIATESHLVRVRVGTRAAVQATAGV